MFRVTLPNDEVLIVRFQHQPTLKQRQARPNRKNWKRGTLCQIWLDAPKGQERVMLGEGLTKVFSGEKVFLDEWLVKPDAFNREAGRRHSLGKALQAAYPKSESDETPNENMLSDREIRRCVWNAYWHWRVDCERESANARNLPNLSADDLRELLQQAMTDRITVVGADNYNDTDPQAVRIEKALEFLGVYDPDDPISVEPVIEEPREPTHEELEKANNPPATEAIGN